MPREVSVFATYQFQNLIPNKQKKNKKKNKSKSFTRKIIKWKRSEQRHALLFSVGRCIVVHRSRAGWKGVCMCGGVVGLWWGGGEEKKKTVMYMIWTKRCSVPPKRISCNISRDISRKKVPFQMT